MHIPLKKSTQKEKYCHIRTLFLHIKSHFGELSYHSELLLPVLFPVKIVLQKTA